LNFYENINFVENSLYTGSGSLTGGAFVDLQSVVWNQEDRLALAYWVQD
jgi:hypothetical protein